MRRPGRIVLFIGAVATLFFLVAHAAARLYTETLWFAELGSPAVYWTRLGAAFGVRLAAAIASTLLVALNLTVITRRLGAVQLRRHYGNLEIAERVPHRWIVGGALVLSLLAGWWLADLALGEDIDLTILSWLHQGAWGREDPVFGRDLSFYLYSLPLYDRLLGLFLLTTLWSATLAALGYILTGTLHWSEGHVETDRDARVHLAVLGAVIVLLLAFRYWVGRYGVLLEGSGVGGAIGYTDIQIRIPARRAIAALAVLAAAAFIVGAWRRSWAPPALGMLLLGGGALALGQFYPVLIQRLRVEPNQIALESPYLNWQTDYTRLAFGLEQLERRTLPYHPAAPPEPFSTDLRQLPLWDEAQLRAAYNRTGEGEPYDQVSQVATDRYGHGPGRQQVAVAVRELDVSKLPASLRTWRNLHLEPRYTRGHAIIASPMARATAAGEPVRWLQGGNPAVRDPAAPPELQLDDPVLHFGAILGREGSEQEYVLLVPGRDSTLPVRASAGALPGIPLNSFARRLAFAWRFHDRKLLSARNVPDESRLLFRRPVLERLGALAPFLVWDARPQPVIYDGRIVWIVDGYTVSRSFPLSRALTLRGIGEVHSLRNSIKATVDGASGAVTLYQVAREDPFLAPFRRAAPGLIRDLAAMPEELRAHLRYPALLLQAQAENLRADRAGHPEAILAGEGGWQLPPGSDGGAMYRPEYMLTRLPTEHEPEFTLSVPLLTSGRGSLAALLVARSDPPHYGELQLFEAAPGQRIPGPTEVASLMERDPAVAAQLSLWGLSGSTAHLGRVRIVPGDGALLYLRPVFLTTEENSAPVLSRMIASDGRTTRMAASLAGAIAALGAPPPAAEMTAPPPVDSSAEWRQRALDLLDEAEQRLKSGDWAGFGARWSALRALLRGDRTSP